MKIKIKTFAGVIFGALMAIVLVVGINHALANPTFFPPHTACSANGSAATTSIFALSTTTPTATSTCDFFNSITSLNVPTAADNATLAIQFRAPQSTTVLTGALQYSDDNVDWYGDNLIALSTTTSNATLDVARTFTLTASGAATTSRAISIQTPTRYVRVVFSVTAGSATSSVWATFIPKKQVK